MAVSRLEDRGDTTAPCFVPSHKPRRMRIGFHPHRLSLVLQVRSTEIHPNAHVNAPRWVQRPLEMDGPLQLRQDPSAGSLQAGFGARSRHRGSCGPVGIPEAMAPRGSSSRDPSAKSRPDALQVGTHRNSRRSRNAKTERHRPGETQHDSLLGKRTRRPQDGLMALGVHTRHGDPRLLGAGHLHHATGSTRMRRRAHQDDPIA